MHIVPRLRVREMERGCVGNLMDLWNYSLAERVVKGRPASGEEGTEGKDLLKQAVVVRWCFNRTSLVICNRRAGLSELIRSSPGLPIKLIWAVAPAPHSIASGLSL